MPNFDVSSEGSARSVVTVVSALMGEETLRRAEELREGKDLAAPRISHGLGFIDHGRHKEAKLRCDRRAIIRLFTGLTRDRVT